MIGFEFEKVEMERQVEIACKGAGTVLITGETGTGKTTLARMIHDRSPRSGGPFISINLATLHEGTFESELFGHEKGAFTGADHKRVGQLELAQGGTVFLDEVSELPPRFQARLLEFLNSRTFRPLGGKNEIALDARVIAASNQDLVAAVKSKHFRKDLFHRLRVIPVELKPLRERGDDLDSILHSCLSEVAAYYHKSIHRIAADAAEIFESYPWPGNFRELKNAIEYTVLATHESEIKRCHLPDWLLRDWTHGIENGQGNSADASLGRVELPLFMDYQRTLETFERLYFQQVLSRTGGRVGRAAQQIKLSQTTFTRRLRAYGLAPTQAGGPHQTAKKQGPAGHLSAL